MSDRRHQRTRRHESAPATVSGPTQEPVAAPAPVDLQRAPQRNGTANTPAIDRLPPADVESEQAVLGCCLLSPDCIGDCIERLKMGPEVFYDLRHQTIFKVLVDLYDARASIDTITVRAKLKDAKLLAAAGGLAYLSSLPDAVHSSAALPAYLENIIEKYQLRKLIQTCTSIVGRVFEHQGAATELLDEAERDMLQITGSGRNDAMPSARELVNQAIGDIEESWKNKGAPTGIQTGFADLDRMTGGLHPGTMVVIAGRPSLGKSAISMNIVEHVAVTQKIPCGVFSLEMTGRQLITRLLAARARVNLCNIREGFMSDRDFPKLTNAAGNIAVAPLHIDDSSGLSILELKAKARRMAQQHGIKLLVVDYLQLLSSMAKGRDTNREQEIARISSGLKSLAKELQIPVIVISQLNRELEKRKGDKPRLSDIRESGAIEQDADFVGLLYKENSGEEGAEDDERDAIAVGLLIAKQRDGPTGTVDLTFLKSYTRFESAAKISTEDVPAQHGEYRPPHSD